MSAPDWQDAAHAVVMGQIADELAAHEARWGEVDAWLLHVGYGDVARAVAQARHAALSDDPVAYRRLMVSAAAYAVAACEAFDRCRGLPVEGVHQALAVRGRLYTVDPGEYSCDDWCSLVMAHVRSAADALGDVGQGEDGWRGCMEVVADVAIRACVAFDDAVCGVGDAAIAV